ncbi:MULTISPECIES: hypothetical protein [Marinobacter]|uniref:Lipoprotein n=1 Tax=Marinobacter suaedae TaxID=3057675 RepID=A0ABT8VX36_9GAMM|nr:MULTISPECIES: hypothetical protein [unclassified Marinobacter]MBZ2168672.1 hypothetical protein [Marinobacter sp. F4216]MDO3720549.1 hypothetical protein [Marinobacter sp. chi1]
MKHLITALTILLLLAAGCQSLPDNEEGIERNVVFLSAEHCLSEEIEDLDKIHYGPCLKIVAVEGQPPQPREDGFIELPPATPITLTAGCVYRHADGTPIPQTFETVDIAITERTFTEAGVRWYLHAHERAQRVTGCEPTLSRSVFPTYKTD